jgi:hypothetical protein
LVSWKHFVNTVHGQCSAKRSQDEFTLPCDGQHSAYFSIQPNIDQNDSETYEFPLNKLKKDIPLPKLIPPRAHGSSNLWFGRGASGPKNVGCAPVHTHLHSDPWDNLYVVVKGQKLFRIYPPSAAAEMHLVVPAVQVLPNGVQEFSPTHKRHGGYRFSHVAGKHAYKGSIKQEFPDWAASSEGTEVRLEEGDLFYLPAGWFHEVTSTCGKSSPVHIAINHWFDPGSIRQASTMEQPQPTDSWADAIAVGSS